MTAEAALPAPLPDGTYDALVVDAAAGDEPGLVTLELTVVSGDHKGDVVQVATHDIEEDPVFLLGIPGTLVVSAGEPRVTLEP